MRGAAWIGICFLALIGNAHAQTDAPRAGAGETLSAGEIRELLDAAKATAKATRENVDYARVVPDILFQILTKLDKLEDKLDKIETEMKRQSRKK
jgi:hypothetical protein